MEGRTDGRSQSVKDWLEQNDKSAKSLLKKIRNDSVNDTDSGGIKVFV